MWPIADLDADGDRKQIFDSEERWWKPWESSVIIRVGYITISRFSASFIRHSISIEILHLGWGKLYEGSLPV